MISHFKFESIDHESPLSRIQFISLSASGSGDEGDISEINVGLKNGSVELSDIDTQAVKAMIESWFVDKASLTYEGYGDQAFVSINQIDGDEWSIDSEIEYATESTDDHDIDIEVSDINSFIAKNINQKSNEIIQSGVLDQSRLVISYSGSGDSGDIDNIEESRALLISQEEWDNFVDEFKESVAYRLIQKHDSGYEINDGGGGEITITFGKTGVDNIAWNSKVYDVKYESYSHQMDGDDAKELLERINTICLIHDTSPATGMSS